MEAVASVRTKFEVASDLKRAFIPPSVPTLISSQPIRDPSNSSCLGHPIPPSGLPSAIKGSRLSIAWLVMPDLAKQALRATHERRSKSDQREAYEILGASGGQRQDAR